MKVYFHLRFVFEKVFVTTNFTMDLNTATFEEMQSLAGIGHGISQAIFNGRANLSRPPTLLDLLEMGIPVDVVKAFVDDLEIKVIPRHEEKDEGIDVQQMVIAALASLQRMSSDVNCLSVAIDNVNMRHAHFESVLKAGGGGDRRAKSRVWRIDHKTDGYGFKQNVGCGESDRHTWR